MKKRKFGPVEEVGSHKSRLEVGAACLVIIVIFTIIITITFPVTFTMTMTIIIMNAIINTI